MKIVLRIIIAWCLLNIVSLTFADSTERSVLDTFNNRMLAAHTEPNVQTDSNHLSFTSVHHLRYDSKHKNTNNTRAAIHHTSQDLPPPMLGQTPTHYIQSGSSSTTPTSTTTTTPHEFPIDTDGSVALPWSQWSIEGNPQVLVANSYYYLHLDAVTILSPGDMAVTRGNLSLLSIVHSLVVLVQSDRINCMVYTPDHTEYPTIVTTTSLILSSLRYQPTILVGVAKAITDQLFDRMLHIQCRIQFRTERRSMRSYPIYAPVRLFHGGTIRHGAVHATQLDVMHNLTPISRIVSDIFVNIRHEPFFYPTPDTALAFVLPRALTLSFYEVHFSPGDTFSFRVASHAQLLSTHCHSRATHSLTEPRGFMNSLQAYNGYNGGRQEAFWPDPQQPLGACTIDSKYVAVTTISYVDDDGLVYSVTKHDKSTRASFTMHREMKYRTNQPVNLLMIIHGMDDATIKITEVDLKHEPARPIRSNGFILPATLTQVDIMGSGFHYDHTHGVAQLIIDFTATQLAGLSSIGGVNHYLSGVPFAHGASPTQPIVGKYYNIIFSVPIDDVLYAKILPNTASEHYPYTELTLREAIDLPPSLFVYPFTHSGTVEESFIELPVSYHFGLLDSFQFGVIGMDLTRFQYPVQHIWFTHALRREMQHAVSDLYAFHHYFLHFRLGYISNIGLIWTKNTAIGIPLPHMRFLLVWHAESPSMDVDMTILCQLTDPDTGQTENIRIDLHDRKMNGVVLINRHTEDLNLTESLIECRNIPMYIGESTKDLGEPRVYTDPITINMYFRFHPRENKVFGLDPFINSTLRHLQAPYNTIRLFHTEQATTLSAETTTFIGSAANLTLDMHHLGLYRAHSETNVVTLCFDDFYFVPKQYTDAQLVFKTIDYNNAAYPVVDSIHSIPMSVDPTRPNCLGFQFTKRQYEYLPSQPGVKITDICPFITHITHNTQDGTGKNIRGRLIRSSLHDVHLTIHALYSSFVSDDLTFPPIRAVDLSVRLVPASETPRSSNTKSPFRLEFLVQLVPHLEVAITSPYPLNLTDVMCVDVGDSASVSATVSALSFTEVSLTPSSYPQLCRFYADVFFISTRTKGRLSYQVDDKRIESTLAFPELDQLPPYLSLQLTSSLEAVTCHIANTAFASDSYLQIAFHHPLVDSLMESYKNGTTTRIEAKDAVSGAPRSADVTLYYFPSSTHLMDLSVDIHKYVQERDGLYRDTNRPHTWDGGRDSELGTDAGRTEHSYATTVPDGYLTLHAYYNAIRPMTVVHITFPEPFTPLDQILLTVRTPYSDTEPGPAALAVVFMGLGDTVVQSQLHIPPRLNQYDLSLHMESSPQVVSHIHSYRHGEEAGQAQQDYTQHEMATSTRIELSISPKRFEMADIIVLFDLSNAGIVPTANDLCTSYHPADPSKDAPTPIPFNYGSLTRFILALHLPTTTEALETLRIVCTFGTTSLTNLRQPISAHIIETNAGSYYVDVIPTALPPSHPVVDPVYYISVELDIHGIQRTDDGVVVQDIQTLVYNAFADIITSIYHSDEVIASSIELDQFVLASKLTTIEQFHPHPVNPFTDFVHDDGPTPPSHQAATITATGSIFQASTRFKIHNIQRLQPLNNLLQTHPSGILYESPDSKLVFEPKHPPQVVTDERHCGMGSQCGSSCEHRCRNDLPCGTHFDCISLFCHPGTQTCQDASSTGHKN